MRPKDWEYVLKPQRMARENSEAKVWETSGGKERVLRDLTTVHEQQLYKTWKTWKKQSYAGKRRLKNIHEQWNEIWGTWKEFSSNETRDDYKQCYKVWRIWQKLLSNTVQRSLRQLQGFLFESYSIRRQQ
jgi:hypothetical protein